MTFAKNGITQFQRGLTGLNVSVSGNGGIYHPGLAINNTDTTLQLGGLTSPFGFAWFHNLDATNAISIRVAAAGTKIIRLLPGEMAGPLRLDSGISAPVAISDAGSPLLEYQILPP